MDPMKVFCDLIKYEVGYSFKIFFTILIKIPDSANLQVKKYMYFIKFIL